MSVCVAKSIFYLGTILRFNIFRGEVIKGSLRTEWDEPTEPGGFEGSEGPAKEHIAFTNRSLKMAKVPEIESSFLSSSDMSFSLFSSYTQETDFQLLSILNTYSSQRVS